MLFETPLMKKLGDQVQIKSTQLIPYENFANNANEIISREARYPIIEPQKPTGTYYWAEFNVGYTGHTLDGLLEVSKGVNMIDPGHNHYSPLPLSPSPTWRDAAHVKLGTVAKLWLLLKYLFFKQC